MTPGARLGQYEIVAPLGAGGMGEVYRARHLSLDREVAVKLLPPRLASDEAARARFEREARAVAALSHPNILAIHDFGQQDGVVYAVTELLRGETLRALVGRGALPTRKVVQIGASIADGLAAAHERGIIHRDIKPENVFITDDGHVKILDFGLARQEVTALADETSDGQTFAGATDPGTVLGTVGYMAPEQVNGQTADPRADIFALGCVLYEMASGRRAFRRATAPETMTAILREDPPDIGGDPGMRPAAFENVVRRCLEKRAAERFQSARDLAFALRSAMGSSAAGERSTSQSPPVAPGARRLRSRVLTAGVLVLGAIALVLAGRQSARVATAPPASVFTRFDKVTDEPGVEATPALSPDGRAVVYAKAVGTDTALYLLRVGSRHAQRLSGAPPARDLQPAFSPDGERIAFRSDRDGGGVFLMTASGESVTRLTDVGYSPRWSPDGTEIVVSTGTFSSPTDLSATARGLTVVNVASGLTRALAAGDRALQPCWSPTGARIAYWGIRGQSGQRDIWTIAARGSGATTSGVAVTDDAALDWSPAWSPDGRYLYFSSTRGGTMNLWRVPVDETTGRVLGNPEPMTTPSAWSGDLSFSRDGTRLAFAGLDYRSELVRVPFDAARETVTGPPVPMVPGTRPMRDHEVSPDGNWIVFTGAGAQEDLFIARTDGTEYRRLTDDTYRDRGPAWSPDGSRIAFYSDRSGQYQVWTIRPDGSGLTQVSSGPSNPGIPVWSPDGTHIAYGYYTWGVIDMRAPSPQQQEVEPAMSATERFMPIAWSPDGRRIAGPVAPVDGSVASLGIYTFATKAFSRVAADEGQATTWAAPAWLADSRRLIVRRHDGVGVVDADTGAVRPLLAVGGQIIGKSVGVSRDNRWITYTETATEGDVWIATLGK